MLLIARFKFLVFVFTAILFFSQTSAQSLSSADRKQLVKKEDSLQVFADSMINAESPADRFRADSNFIRSLVRALRIRHSFSYPFDSLKTVSRLVSPDSVFRIFTWQMKKDEYVLLQKGAIQMKTPDGSLKLFPLFDVSMFTGKPEDSVRSRNNWIGAIYYKMIMKEHKGRKYYTLLGFDNFSIGSNKKWMEILSFNANGEPVFGGPFISFKEDSLKKPDQARFNIEYKKEAGTLFNYNPELDMIIFDHLISETDQPEKKDTYIPDGDFEGFKWKDGKWVHVDKVFNFKLEDGAFPTEAKILDDQGNIDEKQLEDASQRNIDKNNPPKKEPEKKKSAPVKKSRPGK
jgi:hypothetical protein